MSDDLTEIRKRADAATEGPWSMTLDFDRTWALVLHDSGEAAEGRVAQCDDDDNAEFIAHAREDVPRLLDMIVEQRATIARLEAEAEQLKGQRRDGFTAASKAQREVQELEATIDKVRAYADDRSFHAGRKNNTVSSWRIASDLLAILTAHDTVPVTRRDDLGDLESSIPFKDSTANLKL